MAADLPAYHVGDHDQRPWGEYEVTAVGINAEGEEYCEKKLIILPQQILSLQSHQLRRELCSVTSGELTFILNGSKITLQAGQDIAVPLGSIHAMANVSDVPCVIFERQDGICREADIKRYLDAYGRDVETSTDPVIIASIATYTQVLNVLKK